VHREPLYTNRRDLVKDYPTVADRRSHYRLPTRYASIQEKDYSKQYPLILTSGRLVEYEGGGDAASHKNFILAIIPLLFFFNILLY
jgi:formate dehydrogenase major subunit